MNRYDLFYWARIAGEVIALAIVAILATGCAGLNVSWSASYNMPQTACVANSLIPCPVVPVPTK